MKAFLSHTGKDKDLVRLVQQKLTNDNSWFDAVDIENGERIPDKISEGLRIATHFILFWSDAASKAPWVLAELNAAFVQTMKGKCKFMIFNLDGTQLPELLQPYKYDLIDKTNLEMAANYIASEILSLSGVDLKISAFVNRNKEIEDIEDAVRENYKLIILHGILGIGKASLAEKALLWLFPNIATNRIVIDLEKIPGLAELAIEFSYKLNKQLINANKTIDEQKNNIRYYLEYITDNKMLIMFKDVKKWLNEDGTLNGNLAFIFDIIVMTELFDYPVIVTSSRFIDLPNNYINLAKQFAIKGMSDQHISQILKNNFPKSFVSDDKKNMEFSKHLYGYPLGAKLGAYSISNHGYNYYLEQEFKIQDLKVGIAKNLISYSNLSTKCQEYLQINALAKSRLRNEEYSKIFPELGNIADLADEAFFSGMVKINDDGCYILEPLVLDFFYDQAFSSEKRNHYTQKLEEYLLSKTLSPQSPDYMRLITVAIHMLILNNNFEKAVSLRSELTETIKESMWDQYNSGDYDNAYITACGLIENVSNNYDALYVKSLCLTRFDQYEEAQELLDSLLKVDKNNSARYYYALGRIEKRKGSYNQAIELFSIACKKRNKYLSPYREIAECYLFLDSIDDAKNAIQKAKDIDSSNIFVMLIEARIHQKENNYRSALQLLSNCSANEPQNAQISFRYGRIYDQMGDIDKAIEYYNKALIYNSKTYDAELCLLNHMIISSPKCAKDKISELKSILKGKRKYILTNIEARFIGYHENDTESAIFLLKTVPKHFRDRQWYAVHIQLLENTIKQQNERGRLILAEEYKKDLEQLKQEYTEKYGCITISDIDLLPDA